MTTEAAREQIREYISHHLDDLSEDTLIAFEMSSNALAANKYLKEFNDRLRAKVANDAADFMTIVDFLKEKNLDKECIEYFYGKDSES